MSASLDIPSKRASDANTPAASVPSASGLWSQAIPRSMPHKDASPKRQSSGTSFPRSTPQWLDLEVKKGGAASQQPPRRMTALGEYTTDFDYASALGQFRQLQHPHIVIRRSSSIVTPPASDHGDDLAIDDSDHPSTMSRDNSTNNLAHTLSNTSLSSRRRSSTSRPSRTSSITPSEAGEVLAEIDLIPCSAEELVAFVDRPAGMKRAMGLHSGLFDEIRGKVGDEAYEGVLLPLWLETTRDNLVDFKWLVETRKLLVPDLEAPEHEQFLWKRFAGVVGWDGEDEELDASRARPGLAVHSASGRFEHGRPRPPRRGSTLDPWKEEEREERERTEEEDLQCRFVKELKEREKWDEPVVLFFN